MIFPQRIKAQDLAPFIPHSGRMVLLDEVIKWDDESIQCVAKSHHDQDNPLRVQGVLSSIHSIEYAAQAISFHAALLSITTKKPLEGMEKLAPISSAFLAVVKDFFLVDMAMDQFGGQDLFIWAKVHMTGPRMLQYWTKSSIGKQTISEGLLSLVIEG